MVNGKLAVCLLTASLLGLGGCVSTLDENHYSRDDVQRTQTVQTGTIVSLRPVSIEGTKSGTGSVVGGLTGGLAGSTIGAGKGSWVAAAVMAVAGGFAGAAAEEGITRAKGVEITVREGDGVERSYVQEVGDNDLFRVGERVRILSSNGKSRVTH